MRSKGNFNVASSAGLLLAFVLSTGAPHALPCLACEVTSSYQAAVRVYDRARMWGVIARWWIDPELTTSPHEQRPAKLVNVCQAHPMDTPR